MSRLSQSQTMRKLDFSEKLIQPGKKETVDQQLKRIKALHGKLKELEQDITDVRSLDAVRKQLIQSTVLHHKDRGVKAYAACCLADLLRLYAPDAPYTPDELRDIFQFFSAQISINMKTAPGRPLQPTKTTSASQSALPQTSQRITEVPFYTEYYYLLDSLANIKSIVLACDVPGGDDIVTGFFEGFVEIVRSDMNRNLFKNLVMILTLIIEESATVPSGAMDCIITQFENYADQPETPSFQLIVGVCNQVPDKLQRHMLSHFGDIQKEHGKDPSPADLKTLTASHDLLLTIYRHCPGLLLNVIPVLEENLRAADEIPLRQLTTKTLGIMFGERPVVGTGVADIAKAYPSCWRAWLGRKVDKALPVRLVWVESSRGILSSHPELRGELEVELAERTQDSDEKVRAAICKVFGSLDYETTLHHLKTSTLRAVAARLSDKKHAVRAEALTALSKLWNSAYVNIESQEPETVRQFAWIPEAILTALVKKDTTPDLRSQITSAFKNLILPLPAQGADEQAWVDKLLLVAVHLDETAFKVLERLTGLRGYARGASPYRAFIASCEENNGGILLDPKSDQVKIKLNYITSAMAVTLFADADKAKKDMDAFADTNDPRLYKLFKACVDPLSDLKAIVKAKNELVRRINQAHTDILETFTVLIDSATWNLVNHSSISSLIKRLQTRTADEQSRKMADASHQLLSLMAKECAPMFKSHVEELVIVIGEKKSDKLVEVGLQALAALVKVDADWGPTDRKVPEKILKLALEGTPRQAKFAARFICYSHSKDKADTLIDDIMRAQVGKKENPPLLTHLRALSELARSAPSSFEQKSEEIMRFVLQKILYRKGDGSDDEESDIWQEEEELPVHVRAKVTALRICAHRAIGFARSPDAMTAAEPIMKLLGSVLQNEGKVTEETAEPGIARPHLRLRAALCMLKLANVKHYDKSMGQYFELLALTLQDPCYQVRLHLLNKLSEVLGAQRLTSRWNVLPCMVAMDVEKENILLAKNVMLNVARACAHMPAGDRIERIEIPLARLLLILTHHPDFDAEPSNLKDIAKFIELYLDCYATRDNIGLLYHIVNKVKTVKDVSRDDSSDLYRLSELAQIIIRNRADAQHWVLTTFPGKVKLPRDIFHNLTDNQEVLKISRRSFLPEETIEWAKNLGRKAGTVAGPSRREPREAGSPKRKVRSSPTKPRKKRRAKPEADDDEDSSDEEDEDEDEDEDKEMETESEDEGEEVDGEAVMGRGGRRGAKTKAKKGLSKKQRRKRIAAEQAKRDDESQLTEEE